MPDLFRGFTLWNTPGLYHEPIPYGDYSPSRDPPAFYILKLNLCSKTDICETAWINAWTPIQFVSTLAIDLAVFHTNVVLSFVVLLNKKQYSISLRKILSFSENFFQKQDVWNVQNANWLSIKNMPIS